MKSQLKEKSIKVEHLVPEMASLPDAIGQEMPTHSENWNVAALHSGHKNNIDRQHFAKVLRQASKNKGWKWPKRRVIVITDPHADAEAFIASLVVSGGVIKISEKVDGFKLSKSGKKSTFIIDGDCLDKGPSNLQLLKSIRHLMDLGAKVKLLAGNHDMRLFMGVYSLGLKRKPVTEHLFVRMGAKVVPLLLEIHATYLKGKKLSKHVPDEDECKQRLYPRDDWFEQFPAIADGWMSEAAIQRELDGIRKKTKDFAQACKEAGLTMRDVYAIARKCRQLFLKPKGEFAWFYQEMQLAYRRGSFLFIHAGLDDAIINTMSKKGIRYINRQFRYHIKNDLFHFYYGSLANTMRTKYRLADLTLTDEGVKRVNRLGLYAVVQGHINRTQGQRLALKQGLIHIECDITLDRNSRKKEGLSGIGIGVTIIDPKKRVIGISNDYPFVKVFEPERYLTH